MPRPGRFLLSLFAAALPPTPGVHVLVEVRDAEELSTAAIAQAGGAFDRLAGEPELYSDADLVERAG
jgi:hypothetical protein